MAVLENKLAGLKGRLFRLWCVKSLIVSACALAGLVAALAALDALFDLPYALRIALSGAGAVAAAAAFFARGFSGAVRAVSDEELVQYLEKRYPDFKDALVSALQFARPNPDDSAFNSPQLAREVVSQAERLAERIHADEVLRARQSRRVGTACLAIVILAAGSAWASPRYGRALARTFLDVSFPQRTFYRMESPSSDFVRVPRGEPLRVRIVPDRFASHRPARATIHVRAGAVEHRQGMTRFENDAFSWEFDGVSGNFAFTVRADDWTSPACRVEVVERPRIDRLVLTVAPPPYTGLPPQEIPVRSGAGRSGGGDVAGVRGTRVAFQGETNKPLRSAALVLGEERLAAEVDWTRFSGGFELQESMAYHFDVEDEEGFSESQPARYQVRVVPDRPPEVRITSPEEAHLDLTPFAVLPLSLSASDDFGLARVTLLTCATEAEENWTPVHTFLDRGAPPAEEPKHHYAIDWLFKMSDLRVAPGLLIRYRIEVADFHTPPNVSASQEYRIRIKEPSEISREVTRRLEDLRREMEQSLDRQLAAIQQATGVLDRPADDPSAAQALIETALAQQGMSADLEHRDRYLRQRIIWYFDVNRLGEPVGETTPDILRQEVERKEMLQRISGQFRVLIDDLVPVAAAALKEARVPEGGVDAEAVGRAIRSQERVATEIRSIIDQMQKVSSLSQIISGLRAVQEMLARIAPN